MMCQQIEIRMTVLFVRQRTDCSGRKIINYSDSVFHDKHVLSGVKIFYDKIN